MISLEFRCVIEKDRHRQRREWILRPTKSKSFISSAQEVEMVEAEPGVERFESTESVSPYIMTDVTGSCLN